MVCGPCLFVCLFTYLFTYLYYSEARPFFVAQTGLEHTIFLSLLPQGWDQSHPHLVHGSFAAQWTAVIVGLSLLSVSL